MKALVFGSQGQLGSALAATVPAGIEYIGVGLPELDITDADAVSRCCEETRPDIVINAAAYTAVDRAETESEQAAAVNVEGAKNCALAAAHTGSRLVYISTDFVFDGERSEPYGVDAETDPQNVYGRTKRDGERVALSAAPGRAVVLRTAWLYSKTGANFVKTILRLLKERDEISVVADQVGSPTWANSLANAVWAFAGKESLCGVFHWTDAGSASWHEFAEGIQEEALSLGLLKKPATIHGVATEDYPTEAKRPRYSVLDCSTTYAALDLYPAEWRVNLRRMLEGMAN